MFPTSIAGSILISAPLVGGVAGLDRAHVHLLELEVASRLDADQVSVRAVRAADVAADRGDRRVLDDGNLGADRPDEARRADPLSDLLRRRLAKALAERVGRA